MFVGTQQNGLTLYRRRDTTMSNAEPQTATEKFEVARAKHTENMKRYNTICADILRCDKERKAAIEAGKEAETNWRSRFRSLRGQLTDELKAEHSQRIASRELADEFTGLISVLELDKQSAMLACCSSGKAYVETYRTAFEEITDRHWEAAMKTISPELLWAIRLRLQREEILPTHGEGGSASGAVAGLIGSRLTRTASALPLKMLEEIPALKNIGMHTPPLTGVDMYLYRSPQSRAKLGERIRAQREVIEGGKAL